MRRVLVLALLFAGVIFIGIGYLDLGAGMPGLQRASTSLSSLVGLRRHETAFSAADNSEHSQSGLRGAAVPAVAEAPPESGIIAIQPAPASAVSFAESICLALAKASVANDLPIDFFTRLIWQESHFDPNAQSYAGAQGIAQFMPGTARGRGLADPFDPHVALQASAQFLRALRSQFGNLGLAAAAYNAGPGRVQAWLNGRGPLPGQTRAYVYKITGRPAEEWVGVADKTEDRMGTTISCGAVAKLLGPGGREPASLTGRAPTSSAWGPWGLQLAGNSSEGKALADYKGLQKKFPAILGNRQPFLIRSRVAGSGTVAWYLVRVTESTRERANILCSKLEAAGGKCIVLKN